MRVIVLKKLRMFTHKKGIQLCADEINRLEFAFSQDWISEENNVQPTLECVHVDFRKS